jgi:hypothetical protein
MKRQHTLMTHFKLSLARIEQMGYARSVQFSVPSVPRISQVAPPIVGYERSGRSAFTAGQSSQKAQGADATPSHQSPDCGDGHTHDVGCREMRMTWLGSFCVQWRLWWRGVGSSISVSRSCVEHHVRLQNQKGWWLAPTWHLEASRQQPWKTAEERRKDFKVIRRSA